MARFDIYPNPIAQDRKDLPFVLEIQSDLLYRFTERVCVPLVREGFIPGLTDRFNPFIVVEGEALRLHPLGIAVFLIQELRDSVGSAKADATPMELALNMLFRGY